jgi:hypothetical protein
MGLLLKKTKRGGMSGDFRKCEGCDRSSESPVWLAYSVRLWSSFENSTDDRDDFIKIESVYIIWSCTDADVQYIFRACALVSSFSQYFLHTKSIYQKRDCHASCFSKRPNLAIMILFCCSLLLHLLAFFPKENGAFVCMVFSGSPGL